MDGLSRLIALRTSSSAAGEKGSWSPSVACDALLANCRATASMPNVPLPGTTTAL